MENQNWQAGLTNPNVISNSSITNHEPHDHQLGVNPGQFVEHEYPPGYRFRPRDYELILYYLQKKMRNQTLPPNSIYEVELYRYNPEDLAGMYEQQYGQKEWYFFTPRNKKYPNGDRPNRAAGNGYWKATGADKNVTYGRKICGSKKTLVFYRGRAPGGDKTDWIMHEFKASSPSDVPKRKDSGMRLDDWVLCRIYNKTDGPPRNSRFNGQPDDYENDGDLQEENETLVPHDNADEVFVPAVAGNYNSGTQLGHLDTYGNSANHENSQNGLAIGSQDHALPSNPQSQDLPLEQNSYLQETISNYEFRYWMNSFPSEDEPFLIDFSSPSDENIDQLFSFDDHDPSQDGNDQHELPRN